MSSSIANRRGSGKTTGMPTILFFVLMLCLKMCFSDASSISEEETSSSSSVIARTSADVAQNGVPTMEEESGSGGAMEEVTSLTNRVGVIVASSDAALTSRHVFDGVDDGAAATITTIEMCQQQTVQLQKQHQQQQQQTERRKDENAQFRADRELGLVWGLVLGWGCWGCWGWC